MGRAGLEDYAYVARGLSDYARWIGGKDHGNVARAVIRRAWKRFYTGTRWRQTERSLLPIAVEDPSLADAPMYSPSAALLDASLEMGENAAQARRALMVAHSDMQEAPFFHATQVRLLDRWVGKR